MLPFPPNWFFHSVLIAICLVWCLFTSHLNKCIQSKAEFLSLSTSDVLGQVVPYCRWLFCTLQDVERHARPLLTRCQQHTPPVVTNKSISRHCRMSLGAELPQLRTPCLRQFLKFSSTVSPLFMIAAILMVLSLAFIMSLPCPKLPMTFYPHIQTFLSPSSLSFCFIFYKVLMYMLTN